MADEEFKINKTSEKLNNAIWDGTIDYTSDTVKSLSKKIRTKINTVISDNYQTKTPMILNSLVAAKIDPDIEKMINLTSKGYDDVIRGANKFLAYGSGIEFTKKELSSLSNKKSVIILLFIVIHCLKVAWCSAPHLLQTRLKTV